jgi:hypothetical protein
MWRPQEDRWPASRHCITLKTSLPVCNTSGNGSDHSYDVTDRNGLHPVGSNGNGSDVGRLTAKQLSAIFSLAKTTGWSNKQVRDFSQEMLGKFPDFLNKKEASAVIQHLQSESTRGHRSVHYSTVGGGLS